MTRWMHVVAAAAAVWASFGGSNTQATETGPTAIVPNRPPLAATPFIRLPLGSVRADGWLLKQLELQKSGLTGAAEGMYEALTPDSGWLGGKGEGWEKGPYYVRGLIALAYTLDDAELKDRAKKWIDWALQSQKPDGAFGPASNDDWWPRMVVLYYLRDYYEATGDARVVPFFTNYFKYELAALPGRPLRDWGRSRAGDNIDVVLWTYNRTGDGALLDLAKRLYDQAYPWTSIFTNNRFYGFGDDFQPHHIVNVNQALKMPAVSWQFTHDPADLEAFSAGLAHLNRQYGRIDGQISGTEMLSGLASTDGVELCADVERIVSDGIAISILGDPAIADGMEKVAYNSLPAHTSPKMQQITYYQLLNQATATIGGHGFTQDYANGNVPGPHSGFPCCCYNWHAAWPKFISNMWAATSDGGLALIAYGPNRVTTTVAGGVPIVVTQQTEYPFAETVTLKIDPQKPATFPLVVRVPGWCSDAKIAVNGEAVPTLVAGTFQRIAREWKAGDVVTLTFPMAVRTSTWVNDSTGIERGPLAFALRIKEDWKKSHEFLHDFNEYEVLPDSPWNYALQLDARTVADLKVQTRPVSDVPYATDAAPVTLSVPAKRLPDWGLRTALATVTLGRSDHAWHPIGEANLSLDPHVPHRIRVAARGAALRVFIDDARQPVLVCEDATFAAGGVGLRSYGTAAKFNDVKLNGTVIADFNDGRADAWQSYGGQWAVKDGAYTVDAAKDGKSVLKRDAPMKDFTFEATVILDGTGDAGLMFRVQDPTASVDGYRGYYVGLGVRSAMSQDAAEPPVSPVTSDAPTETVELIPFGSAKLRMSYFPTLSVK